MCILRAVATEASWAGGYVSPPRMRLYAEALRRVRGKRLELRPRASTGGRTKEVPTVADRGRHTVPRSPVLDSYRRGAGRSVVFDPVGERRCAPQHGRRNGGGEFERLRHATQRAHPGGGCRDRGLQLPRPAQTPVSASSASWVRIGRALTGQPLAWVRSDRLMASCTHFDRCARARLEAWMTRVGTTLP
jgi:hypothetical protein